jgi:hypothetical protein
MKYMVLSCFALVCLAAPAVAQERNREGGRHISLGEMPPTPEMWFYEQARRQYDDPQAMVRLKAEHRAAERQRRIAARKWFGYSNSRPLVSTDPIYGSHSPHWAGNSFDPYRWRGTGAIVVRRSEALHVR